MAMVIVFLCSMSISALTDELPDWLTGGTDTAETEMTQTENRTSDTPGTDKTDDWAAIASGSEKAEDQAAAAAEEGTEGQAAAAAEEETEGQDQAPAAETESEEAAETSSEWICPQCGAAATGNFCSNCGAARDGGTSAGSADHEADGTETAAEEAAPWEKNVLKEEHGTVGEIGANGQTAEENEIVFGIPEWKRSDVSAVYVLDSTAGMPENAVDISAVQDGSVMGWMDESNALYIAGEGGVKAHKNAASLFAWFENATQIRLNGNLHTEHCTTFSHMFYHLPNLEVLDIQGMRTDSAQDFTKMFCGCRKLSVLDVTELATDRVSSFFAMFCKCEKLEELDLSGFDTRSAVNMRLMFSGCTALQSIVWDNELFNTRSVTTMTEMFEECPSLTYLDLSAFDFFSLEKMNHMFEGCISLEDINIGTRILSPAVSHEGVFAGALLEPVYGTNAEAFFGEPVSDTAQTGANGVNADNTGTAGNTGNTGGADTAGAAGNSGDRSAYSVIIDEYKGAMLTFVSSQDSDYVRGLYPHVNMTLVHHQYSWPDTTQLYYTYYDIDGNGSDELLVGSGTPDGSSVSYYDIFTSDGVNVKKLFYNESLGERSYLTIYTDGSIHFQGSNGAADGTVQCWMLAGDGVTPVMLLGYDYHYDEAGQVQYLNVAGTMSPEEYEGSLAGKTAVTVTGWTML